MLEPWELSAVLSTFFLLPSVFCLLPFASFIQSELHAQYDVSHFSLGLMVISGYKRAHKKLGCAGQPYSDQCSFGWAMSTQNR